MQTPKTTYDAQLLEEVSQICYNVAWMIFDEVNAENNTEELIDLSCLLEVSDAQAIIKQKIYDLG